MYPCQLRGLHSKRSPIDELLCRAEEVVFLFAGVFMDTYGQGTMAQQYLKIVNLLLDEPFWLQGDVPFIHIIKQFTQDHKSIVSLT